MAAKAVERTIEEEVVTGGADECDNAGSHIPFNISGKTFDLCETHKARISKPARKVTKVASDSTAIREWAKAHKIEVNERGRISKEVREAYEAAH